jgi:ATP dependent DNA ligase domain
MSPASRGQQSTAGRPRLDSRNQAHGFRIIAYRDGNNVRLMTRRGYDFADRFPLIIDAIAALPARSCVIDGEAIACE